ncbi:TPA: radical SAM protein [Candidatus Woesearchaeota archaeon]|nr:radical SAM protein [Candidatus Woesearchaeota archaeon]
MDRVDLKVGFSCNSRCTFCVQGDKRFVHRDKGPEELKRVLRENYGRGIREVVFTGGECTIRHDILGLVAYARCLGYRIIQIQTNGRRFCYPEFCRAMVDAGATEFSPSIHGSCPEIHDAMTQAPGSFSQVVQGIRNLKELGQRVMTNTVVTKQNCRDLPRLAKLLVDLDVDQFQFAFVHILGSAAKNKMSVVPRKSEAMPYIKEGLDIGRKAGKIVMTEAIPYCFMQGYEDCIAERIIPHTRVEDAAWVIEDYTIFRTTEGKVKSEHCRECRYFKVCEGPWKEYPELYGWEEFVPVHAGADDGYVQMRRV